MNLKEFQRTVLAQYANSTRLKKILEQFNICVDPKLDIDKFFLNVFDLDTCNDYGLKIWARIVAAPRTVKVFNVDFFGFQGTELKPFNEGVFYSGKRTSDAYTMGSEAWRQMIYFKAMVNIMNTTLPEINSILWKFFDIMGNTDGDVYAQELSPMHMRIVFRFLLTPIERAIFRTYGTLIRPAGVGMEFYEILYDVFGFQGSDLRPFNQGQFFMGPVDISNY